MKKYLAAVLVICMNTAFSESTESNGSQPTNDALESARSVVKATFEDMEKEERFIEDAYQSQEYETLSKYTFNNSGTGAPGASAWSGEEYGVYLKCDTAWRDMLLYAGALKNDLSESNATIRKILDKQKTQYQKSKEECKRRLTLSAKDAWLEEEARVTKLREEREKNESQ